MDRNQPKGKVRTGDRPAREPLGRIPNKFALVDEGRVPKPTARSGYSHGVFKDVLRGR